MSYIYYALLNFIKKVYITSYDGNAGYVDL